MMYEKPVIAMPPHISAEATHSDFCPVLACSASVSAVLVWMNWSSASAGAGVGDRRQRRRRGVFRERAIDEALGGRLAHSAGDKLLDDLVRTPAVLQFAPNRRR